MTTKTVKFPHIGTLVSTLNGANGYSFQVAKIRSDKKIKFMKNFNEKQEAINYAEALGQPLFFTDGTR